MCPKEDPKGHFLSFLIQVEKNQRLLFSFWLKPIEMLSLLNRVSKLYSKKGWSKGMMLLLLLLEILVPTCLAFYVYVVSLYESIWNQKKVWYDSFFLGPFS